MSRPLISIVIPVHNEEHNLPLLYDAIAAQWDRHSPQWLVHFEHLREVCDFEVIFVDDGSTDHSLDVMEALSAQYDNVSYLSFSRNFGKEIATTAGVHASRGDAVIMMDADLQHPTRLLTQLIVKWQQGYEVVIGVRRHSKSDSMIKRWGGKIFYRLIRVISEVPIVPHATDYRLLDRVVVEAFNALPERNRITRGLIDWLGFRRGLLYFDADDRALGEASYNTIKLIRLAVTSVISLSLFPLRFAGYLGFVIVMISLPLGAVMFVDRYTTLTSYEFTGSAILAAIILFLIGVVLICIGLLSFYIGHIYHETQGRQMYIVRQSSRKEM